MLRSSQIAEMELYPKVSIVIPVYNGSEYLREAIDSALAQTYKNIEVIVVNDGSNDGGKTEKIARSYGDKICYVFKENNGVASALNMGIRVMRGEYFSWLSHDDVYYPDKIEVQINLLKHENDDAILYGDYAFIDTQSNLLGYFKIPSIVQEQFLYLLITSHPINGCTSLIPKPCFNTVGLFNEKLRVSQDYEMWFRLVRHYRFIHIPRLLVKSRLHPEQGTYARRDLMSVEENDLFIKCLQNFTRDEIFIPSKQSVARCYMNLGFIFKVRDYKSAAAYAFALSLKNLNKSKSVRYYYERLLLIYYKIVHRRLTYQYWKLILKSLFLELKRVRSFLVYRHKTIRIGQPHQDP